jgi:hypothetical protein
MIGAAAGAAAPSAGSPPPPPSPPTQQGLGAAGLVPLAGEVGRRKGAGGAEAERAT